MKVVVVGAGVLGASVAYHLAREGAEVVIVDDNREGRATAAGAGIISPWTSRYESRDWYRIARGGGRYYPELLRHLAEDGETDVSYRKVGVLMVSDDPAELDADERRLAERRPEAPEMGDVSRLSPPETRRLFPPLNERLSAVRVSGGARVDGRLLAAALLRAAQRKGARVENGRAELFTKGAHVAGATIAGARIEADAVALAAGAWAPEALAPLRVRLAVAPQRGQILHLRLPNADTRAWPVVLPRTSHYMLAFDDSRIVVGATREDGTGFDYRVTARGQQELLQQALTLAPGLADATIVETRIGFRPMPPDGKPLLGTIPACEGLFIANGLGPSGLTIGPYAGKLVAQAVLGKPCEIDLSPYSPARAA